MEEIDLFFAGVLIDSLGNSFDISAKQSVALVS